MMGILGNMYDSYSVDDDMTVSVGCDARDLFVKAVMPSKLAFSIKSRWDNFLGNLQDNMFFSVIDTALQVTKGISLNNPFLSRKIWKGTEPLIMQLNLKLVSYDDAYVDVWQPALRLLGMAVPRQLGGTGVKALAWEIPGPKPIDLSRVLKVFNIDDVTVSPNKAAPIFVRIGRLMRLDDLFITDIKFEFDTALEDGYPISADVSMTVSTQDSANMNMLYAIRGFNIFNNIPSIVGA
jgi:hypothetical protein